MKAFALITACLMAAGGSAYYLSSTDTCPLTGCPVAKTGGCCATDAASAACCTNACPACETDCLECCAVCELCCQAGASVPAVSLSAAAPGCEEEECCAACNTPVKIATTAAIAGVTLK